MRLDLKRDALLIIPECDQDRAFIEDTLGLKRGGEAVSLVRIEDVALGYQRADTYVLKGSASTAVRATEGRDIA